MDSLDSNLALNLENAENKNEYVGKQSVNLKDENDKKEEGKKRKTRIYLF